MHIGRVAADERWRGAPITYPQTLRGARFTIVDICTITLLVLQMTPLMQIEKIALDHHIPIIISTQKKYSK